MTCSIFLSGPFRDTQQYLIAAVLVAIGIVLWAITWFLNRALHARRTYLKDPSDLE